jgi:alpha-2-macroglobulin
MKNLPWKLIATGIAGVILIAVAVYFINTRSSNAVAKNYINPAFGEYISSYTAGVIPSGSTLMVVLANNVADSASIGQETSVKLFDFRPSIKGKVYWVDARTLEFRPESRLPSGQVYEATFELSKLVTVPNELKDFKFSFQVVPQNFETSIDNIKPYVKTELNRQKIEGVLSTADFAESTVIEKMLEAKQDNNALKVSWVHGTDGKQHNFIIEDVARKADSSVVDLAIKGAVLGVNRDDEQQITIPALGDFKIVNAKVVQNPTQYVILQFSDPLKEKQELNGLISIDEVTGLDFDIHDNEIWVYPSARLAGSKGIKIESGIRNILDYKMRKPASWEVIFEQLKPEVKISGKGVILPSTDGLVLPFEAVNLRAVDVEIKKVYENNVLQFLQVNSLSGQQEMRRVGKTILKKKIALDNSGVTDLGKWNRFTLDIASLINSEPGAIYQVKFSFKKTYSAYFCDEGDDDTLEEIEDEEESNYEDSYEGGYYDYEYDYYDDYYYGEDYDWEQRDNPCNSSYYTSNKTVARNILASDLGLLAKNSGDGNTLIFVTDLKTTKPISGVQVELYDYQQQVIGTATTDSDGRVALKTKEKPYVLVAKNGAQRGYLTLNDGASLSLSNFDVSGEYVKKGLKGFLYGERGVWRPGDTLHLSFILEDKAKTLPAAHPVVFELQNPQGQVVDKLVRSSSENGFYNFTTATKPDAPTGNWTARIKVGGTEFNQTIKIETIKPNRLKINLDFGTERLVKQDVKGTLDVKWLHGAPGRNLKAEFEVMLTRTATQFKKYPNHIFEDPSRNFYSETVPIYSGSTDSEGHAEINTTLEKSATAPGFLNAVFKGKVYEESGNFSTDRFSLPYSPYDAYVGIKLPEGERYTGILYSDTTHKVDVVTVDPDGNPLSKNIDINIYKLNWRWWWDNSSDNLANYVEGSYVKPVTNGTVTTTNGKGSWNFNIEKNYGRYYIRACDSESGHCTGRVIYVDEPGWYSRSRGDDSKGGATMLTFASDKPKYNIGEKVNLTIPGTGEGRALVSLESGSKVIKTFWVETKQGENKFSFEATSEMAPNVYAYVSLLQPHAQTVNDLPIRLYGVTAIGVEDPATHLEPEIAMPDVLEPGEKVTIKVSEKEGRKMTYTVAMVDEGLLDITKFKTPDAWSKFYAREALGVRTWDLFDEVMGAFGSRIERLLAVGGDAELAAKDEDPRANRFKPVVKYFGPYTIDKGDTKSHTFTMPQYIGSVKTMIVAGYEGAYGKAEKATPVRKPLMVLATLPRVLGPEETLKLPVTLFTQEKGIKNVKVDVKVTGPVSVTGSSSQTVAMSAAGDMTINFDLAVKSEIGIAKVEVTATSGNFKGTDVIEIEVRNPNTPVTKIAEALVDAGKTWESPVVPFGILGTNSALLEVSSMPPINLGPRLYYLLQYPYGCVEQTTSAIFPQIYLSQIKTMTDIENLKVQRNVTAGIEKLKSFITRDGGFAYWPGQADTDEWGSSYAGHFLVEAEKKGYFVPADIIKRWKKYQKGKALEWRNLDTYYNSDLMQAYRLYTLALAGSPELGAMNRLRETGDLTSTAAWMLAAAYAKAGQLEAAKKLTANLAISVKPYRELWYTYGSDIRDKAFILETLGLLGERAKGFALLKEISSSLSNPYNWMSTQEVAYCLKAVSEFAGAEKGQLKFEYTINGGKSVSVGSELPVSQVAIPIDGLKKGNVKVVSESTGALYVRVVTEGTPARGNEEDAASNLIVDVVYTSEKGVVIDPSSLEQGQEFIAEVTVTHPGARDAYYNMALSQVFPSGWEINNARITDDQSEATSSNFTYQDIRDDRVYTFFTLWTGKTKVFRVSLTATYAGKYYLPATNCEAMYDKSIYARKKGKVVEVVKAAGVQ